MPNAPIVASSSDHIMSAPGADITAVGRLPNRATRIDRVAGPVPIVTRSIVIALDAMGGDGGPGVAVEGAAIALARWPDLRFVFFGKAPEISPWLDAMPGLRAASEIVHTEEFVSQESKPSQALRRSRNSSMALAIKSVKEGRAAAAVSSGNTGALMALAKFILKTLAGIDRPALASRFPTRRGDTVMLDLGANVECDARNLVQFAIMGAAFARTVLGLDCPKVGLLNIGVEEIKGNEQVKAAAQILRQSSLPFECAGFVEGDVITEGIVDVVVTDGFTGNAALKTAEGVARFVAVLLREAFSDSLRSKLGYVLARGSLGRISELLNPSLRNGAVFLGLNGLVVKSHGGTNAEGFASAICVAHEMAANDLCQMITDDLAGQGDSEPTLELDEGRRKVAAS